MTEISYGTIETVPQPRDDMSELQYYILANVQRVSAFLSLCGSFYIIREIIGNEQKRAAKLQNVYHRIMLVLSISDCTSSLALFASNWAAPSNVAYDFMQGNVGNIATCDMQAFMLILGCWGVFASNMVLSVYFLLCVKYSWSNERLKSKLERPYHILLAVGALPVSVGPMIWDLYNPTISCCFLQLYPKLCNDPSNDVKCYRGNEFAYKLVYIALYLLPIPIASFAISYSMYQLYRAVRRQEEEAKAFASNATLVRLSRHSRKVYFRAIWYVLSFAVVWVPGLILILMDYSYTLQIITKLFTPMQGEY